MKVKLRVCRAIARTAKRFVRPAIFACLLLLFAACSRDAQAQGTTGSITGTVTDATSAVIAGATVTITQLSTNEAHTATTSDIGTYSVTQLPPGTYSVKVEKGGFKGYEQKDIVLTIDRIAQVNAELQTGSEQQTVTVTGEAPEIQTEASSVGLVVDSQTIQNTPLNGHTSIIGLLALAPGVQGAGAQDQIPVYGVTPSIGGTNAYGAIGFTLDGATNMEVTLQRGSAEVPPLDAIAEFKVITTGEPAEFNQPAQVIVVSRGGENQLHGEAVEFNRSKGTSAKNYFQGATARPPYERNEYGGNLSGPILIPHLYDGRDRSFFFFSFAGFRLTQSAAVSSQQPTVAERAGDFSCFLAGGSCATSATGTMITNPLTGAAFPGNIIPESLFNPVDTQLLKLLYPLPTTSGAGTNTFQNIPYSDNVSRYSVHIDHKINENNQIRGTVLDALYGPNPSVGGSSLQGGMSGIGEHVLNAIAGVTHTFSPTLLLDVYGSYFHLPIYRTPQNVNTNFAAIIPELAPQLIEGAPQIGITNITGVGEQGSKDLEQDAQIDPTITKTLAKHSLKAGFSYVYDNHWNTTVEGPQRGSFSFNGRYTGIAFADFLLGDPTSTGQTTPADAIYRNISSQLGFFVQDDYKVNRQLTINAGIRYDLQVFKNNQYPGEDSLFVPSVGKVVVFAKSYPAQSQPAFIPDTVLSSSVGLPDSLFSYLGQDTHNVAPRFGFAFQPVTNTVIRGAVGLFFDLLPGTYEQSSAFTNLPFEASESYSQPATGAPAFTMNDPFSATGTFSANPSAIAQHSTVTPYTEQFNLAVEHQLHEGLDIRVGYVGQHNVKQNNLNGSTLNINAIPVPIVGVNAQNTNLYQPFSTIDENGAPIFHSTMDALQIGIHKQYSHGFQLNAEYEWSRILGTTSLENPSGVNVNDSYGPIGGTAPQVLAVSYSYELPFGRGKLIFGNAPIFMDKIIHGWQVSGITSISSGGAFSVGYSAPGSPTGLASGRANQVPGVPLYPKHKTLAEWFNPAAFTAPPCYNVLATGPCASVYIPGGPTTYSTYGTSGNNMLRGPAYQDWDISLEKNILWRERYRVQLRAESFNIFNHPNFGGPNASINDTANVGTITGTSGEPRTVEFAAKFNF